MSIATPAQAAPAAPAAPSVIADADVAPDKATAAAVAREYDHPVTDQSSLTETTTVEVLPDGTEELTISTEPVRVRQDESWVDVSTELAETPSGMLAPTASPVPVEFSPGGTGPLARVQTTTGAWMTIASPLGELPDAVVDDSSVTYPDVLPDVDLRLTATISGMSEVLVIKTPEAADDPRLDEVRFSITGAKVADGKADESATATAPDGSTLVSPSPMWWDSADGGDADGPGGAGIAEPVEADNAAAAITVDASAPADADDVIYPAYVDPDFTGGMQYWTLVDSAYPNASYWLGANRGADNQAHVGNISAFYSPDGRAHTDRTFWRLNTSGLQGKHVLSAHFDTQEIYSSACTSNVYNLWLTGIIDPSTTWNRQPAFLAPVSRTTLGPQRSNCAQQYGVGLDAMAAAEWAAANNAPDVTLGMSADNEGDWTSWRLFTSGASMTVRYNTPPGTPWAGNTGGQDCATSGPGPVLRNSAVNPLSIAVLASDADPGGVGVVFWVQDSAGRSVIPANPYDFINAGTHANGVFSVNVPSGLPDGAYRWLSRAIDGIDSSGFSPYCYFQIRNAPPGAPVVTPSVPTTSTVNVGDPITVTLGQRTAGEGVLGFAYTWRGAQAPVYTALPACGGNDNQAAGYHYVCGSSATITVAPTEAPRGTLTVWAFNEASHISAPTTLSWSTMAGTDRHYAAAHQWNTDLGAPVPPADCTSGATTVKCVADNNVSDSNWPTGQYPIAIPAGVSLGDGGQASTPVSYVAGATAENTGIRTVALTVPAGVTTDHFGVVTVATADSGGLPGASLPGWTVRDDQQRPAGEATSSSYIFSRLGGQRAGDVLTVTLPANSGATISGAWYDTGGRDVQAVGPLGDTNAVRIPTVTWPAPAYNGTADVLLVAASRTSGGPTVGAVAGVTTDYQRFLTTTWNGGAVFGHAEDVAPTAFSATWNAGVTSYNVNALQLVLAEPVAPPATGEPGALNFSPSARTPMMSAPGVVVDTTKSFTVGAWMTPTAASSLNQTAISERGQTNSGFFLQLTPYRTWSFVVSPTTQNGSGRVTVPQPVELGQRVFVAGVYDAVNQELRIYFNGDLAAIQGYRQPTGPTASLGFTLGSGVVNGVAGDFFTGRIGNPFVAQAALTTTEISAVMNGSFFPGLD